ncbi:oligosaccharide flippase family protein [Deinococcus sp. UR1]|uniref:oligosaccharide flippase family protein n=1 Tax=Deinococcus sp. UR1 TaxID=1704277 RepID=UPI0011AF8158|nr:oligosaccharide flippase family protein [Deinococcus sp. UR1]
MIKNSIWMISGNMLRAAFQLLYFLLLAKSLGSYDYGLFVAMVALATILSPISSVGFGSVLLREVSKNRNTFNELWGKSIGITIIASVFIIMLVLIFKNFLFNSSTPYAPIVVILFSELIFSKLIEINLQALQAFEKMKMVALFQSSLTFSRLIGVLIIYISGVEINLFVWSAVYMIATLAISIISTKYLFSSIGRADLRFDAKISELKDGIYFALGIGSQSLTLDIDKIILSKVAYSEAVGIYFAAARIIDVIYTPIRSVISAINPTLYKNGIPGAINSITLAAKIIPMFGLYIAIVTLVFFFMKTVIIKILGESFEGADIYIIQLLPILFFRGAFYILADILSSIDKNLLRTTIQICTAILTTFISLYLVKNNGVQGAITGVYVTSFIALAVIVCMIVFIGNRENRSKIAKQTDTHE